MKIVMKIFPATVLFVMGAFFSGCYTELATRDYEENAAYTESEIIDEDGNVTVENNYYLDDDYRQSRFKLSFNYYYPSYRSSWISSYYDSYYHDSYWGLNRHWGSYYYPGYFVIYPTPWWPPIYDPWNPYRYYPSMAYYPSYYPYQNYGNSPSKNPGRVRDHGPTRDNTDPGERSRAIPVTTPNSVSGTAATNPGVRSRVPQQSDDVTVSKRSKNETPWWERQQKERVRTESTDRTSERAVVREKEQRRPESGKSQPKKEGTKTQTRTEQKRSKSAPDYTAPPKRNSDTKGTKKTERTKDERSSYSPPSSRQAPAAAAPRSGGNASGSAGDNSGGRKRPD